MLSPHVSFVQNRCVYMCVCVCVCVYVCAFFLRTIPQKRIRIERSEDRLIS